ncbi:MAG TPA: hypothetical protein VI895_02275 [Bdellovibrionota bacterium]|nr:hypothetical protein [Bdellovibrionota bacterium]
MKSILWIVAVIALCGSAQASTTTPLVSHDSYSVGTGDIETAFSFDADILRGDFEDERVKFNLGVNYFLNDILAPGLEVEVEHLGGENGFRFLPNLKAYWPTHSRVLPYFQVAIGYAHVAGADLFDFGVGPGINFLLSNSVAIGLQVRYDLGTGDGTYHLFHIPAQFAVYFKL